MEQVIKKTEKKAFTIVELLTVMSIIVILMGLVLPALNKVRRYAKDVRQAAQFHSIEVAIDLYHTELDGYPPSSLSTDDDYCGANKLCEAMMGQDLLGFHPKSQFRSDGEDASGNQLYPPNLNVNNAADQANLRARKGPYLELANANAYRMSAIYSNWYNFDPCSFVMCDVYSTAENRGTTGPSKIGMPLLYYRADISKLSHDPNNLPAVNNITHIYDYQDNDRLVNLGAPFYASPSDTDHPLSNGTTFYQMTKDDRITTVNQYRPQRPDSYILISAGFDGLYGTDDDICNFSD